MDLFTLSLLLFIYYYYYYLLYLFIYFIIYLLFIYIYLFISTLTTEQIRNVAKKWDLADQRAYFRSALQMTINEIS